MYEYYPFSTHNGITIVNVLILLFSPVSDNFHLSWKYYHYYYINCRILYSVCKFFAVYFYVLVLTL
jgi:hypothetical protein